jgi:hypothetical protein
MGVVGLVCVVEGMRARLLAPSSTSDGRATIPTKGFSLQLRGASLLLLFYSPLVLRSSALVQFGGFCRRWEGPICTRTGIPED